MKFKKQKYITEKDCFENFRSIYLFGDNTLRKGKKGQAQIRDCPNSFGIVTKRYPSMSEDAFFTDCIEDKELVRKDIKMFFDVIENGDYDTIVVPEDGLGTGLAQLDKRAPNVFSIIQEFLRVLEEECENFKTKNNQNLKI